MSAAQEKIGLWMASMETRHFSFDAFGPTEELARFYLKEGLAIHSARCGGLADDWYSEEEFNVRRVELGTAYVDGSPLVETGGRIFDTEAECDGHMDDGRGRCRFCGAIL